MTPTEQDNELFELCKQVYRATGWDESENVWYANGGDVSHESPLLSRRMVFDKPLSVPLYTSDYLLEKLQQSLKHKNDQITVFNDSKGWSAKLNINFIDDDDIYHHREVNDSYGHDTPLIALLKLTLKLYEEEIL